VWSVFDGDWWDATQIYRKWALINADWVQSGPISQRSDLPQWARLLTVWVNSHWQEVDIFNITGGDGEVLQNRMKNIVARFGSPSEGVGLHWYEWDTLGYDRHSNYTNCLAYSHSPTQYTCGFDTHYPEYFPVREGFLQSVKQLQQMNIKIIPYINARLFDMSLTLWLSKNNGFLTSTKYSSPIYNLSSLVLYEESYGSLANFSVACPTTLFWQQQICSAVKEVTHLYHADGVYLDQIAAAGPRNCWDSSHNHTVGGGDYWVNGYRQLLSKCRADMPQSSLVLTESNAEPFMDGINMFLTLVGFSGNYGGETRIIPAFASIYGGYYLAMGAMFYQQDLTENPDVFAAKIAQQFSFGAQLGWFSLGGRDNQSPYMGMYETLMDTKYDPEINYLQLLMSAKRLLNEWLQVCICVNMCVCVYICEYVCICVKMCMYDISM
jgi:hypothetical protein